MKRNPAFVERWRANRDTCYICESRYTLAVHHIVGAAGRYDVAANLTMLCGACHRRAHRTQRPSLALAEILLAKKRRDPDEFDLERLQKLKGRYWTADDLLK